MRPTTGEPPRWRLLPALSAFVLAVAPAPIRAETPMDLLRAPDTSSPRATLESFIGACDAIYKVMGEERRGVRKRDQQVHSAIGARIYACLNLKEVPDFVRKQTAGEAAACLKELLDRIELPALEDIPGAEEIAEAAASGTPINRWVIPSTQIAIERVREGPFEGAFLFSPETVAKAPELYRRVKDFPYRPGASEGIYRWFLSEPGTLVKPLVKLLPAGMQDGGDGRHAPWQWLGFIVALIGALAVMVIAYRVGRRLSRRFRGDNLFGFCLTLAFPIVAMLTPLLASRFIESQLRLTGKALAISTFLLNIVFLFAAMIVVMGIGGRIAAAITANPKMHPRGLDAQFVRIVCRLLSIVGAVIVFLEGGKYLGIPVSTLFASAGVGGVALALAAQDSLKNLFGSMMIMLDKPFRIGDRIVVKGYDGFVEEIGLRSTKVRLLTGHLTAIPNDEVARNDVENVGRRPHIRRLTDLRLPLDTAPEKLERAVAIVRDILDGHEGYEEGKEPRAYLADIAPDAFTLRFIYWYHPPDYWQFLDHSERVNLEIKRAFDGEGIEFALPTSRTFLDGAKGDAVQGAAN